MWFNLFHDNNVYKFTPEKNSLYRPRVLVFWFRKDDRHIPSSKPIYAQLKTYSFSGMKLFFKICILNVFYKE